MSDSQISLADVKHVAALANLEINDQEAAKFQPQLSAVVDHFQSLSQVDVTNVPVTAQVTGLENITRPDTVGERSLTQVQAINQSPHKHQGYIVVPSILANRNED